MTILLRCRQCNGTGEVPNEEHRLCEALKSHTLKKYFHIPTEDEIASNQDTPPDACNGVPETIPCPVCEGAGTIAFDEEEWDLQILDEEEEAE